MQHRYAETLMTSTRDNMIETIWIYRYFHQSKVFISVNRWCQPKSMYKLMP